MSSYLETQAPQFPRLLALTAVAGVLTTGFVAYAFAGDEGDVHQRAERNISQLIDDQYQRVIDRGW